MNLAEFTAEAQQLARTGFLLRRSGTGAPSAYWHGIAKGFPCVSFRSGAAWLNVTLDGDVGVVHESREPLQSQVPLYAEPYVSLPPVDAVFLLGSERIGRFLKSRRWSRGDPFNSNFPDRLAHEYEVLWQANCPMFREDVAAVAGGWHMPWPDGDFESLISSELLLWTFEDAEPWIEVMRHQGAIQVLQRVT